MDENIGKIIGISLFVLFVVLVLIGVTIVIRQSRKQEQADTKKSSGGGEDIPKGSWRASKPVRWLKGGYGIIVIVVCIGLLIWIVPAWAVENYKEDIAENYHYLDLEDDGFEDRVMTPIMANPVFGEGPPNILDPNNRTRLRRIVIPILHPGNNPGACRILRMINCAEDYSYRFILKTTGIYQGDEYTEKRTWRVGDPPVDCDPQAVAVEIWVERERPGMAGALVNFWQCKVNC